MKRSLLVFLMLILGTFSALYAWEYGEVENIEQTNAQLRLNFNYSLPLPHNFSFDLAEELRFDVIPLATTTLFDYSLTTVGFSYSPIKYVKLDVGYVLKIAGAATAESFSTHWDNPNSFIKHRLYISVTGSYGWGNCKLTLRERLLDDMRFDDFNPITTNQHLLTLRHYIGFTYSVPSYGVSPYIWTEPANSLNANEYARINRRQYIERWCSAVGVKWKLKSTTEIPVVLNFYYRMDFTQSVSATLLSVNDSEVVNQRIMSKYEHMLGVGVEL